uniref:Putative peptidase-like protein n=1 Tax=Ixodes ricinus TaxID=34613 RepID=A0A0K8R9F1_IXORI
MPHAYSNMCFVVWTSLILISEIVGAAPASNKDTRINGTTDQNIYNTTDCPTKDVHGNKTANQNICNTTACQKRAKLIRKLLNDDINPCTDFYGYVCNNWIFNYPIPDDKTATSNMRNINDQMLIDLKDILENTAYKTEEQNVTDKVVVAYHNCVNTSIHETIQFRALETILKSVGGQYWSIWPRLRDESVIPCWQDLYIKMHYEISFHLLLIVNFFSFTAQWTVGTKLHPTLASHSYFG